MTDMDLANPTINIAPTAPAAQSVQPLTQVSDAAVTPNPNSGDPSAQPAAPTPATPTTDWQERYYRTVAEKDAELWQMKNQLASLKTEAEKRQQIEEYIRTGNYKELERMGLSFKDYAQRILNDGKPGPDEEISRLQKEIEDLKGWKDQAGAREQEAQKMGFLKGYVEDFRKTWGGEEFKVVPAWQEAFEVMNGAPMDLVKEVQPILDHHYAQTGRLLPPEELSKGFAPVAKERLDKLASLPAIVERVLAKHGKGGAPTTPPQAQQQAAQPSPGSGASASMLASNPTPGGGANGGPGGGNAVPKTLRPWDPEYKSKLKRMEQELDTLRKKKAQGAEPPKSALLGGR